MVSDLVLTMSEKTRQSFDLLKRRLGFDAASAGDADLVNASLTLIEWCTGEIETGRMVGSIDMDSKTFTEAKTPQFSALKQHIPWAFWNKPEEADQDPPPPLE